MAFLFPLDNIRYFYAPSVPDGWPDLHLVNIRRTVPAWIAANCSGEVKGWRNSDTTAVPLAEFGVTKMTPAELEDPNAAGSELLSTELSLMFENKNDHRKFSNYWARSAWVRHKLLDTRYFIDNYSISNCLWMLKVELLQYRKDLMDWLNENCAGGYEYCTFGENKKCVIGLEFEHREDADLFRLFYG